MKKFALGSIAALSVYSALVYADQVFLDDLIVDASICVGMDCVNGESFGFDTIRLKENNLRISFIDTSNTASFPSRDWQITANDSANGGLNKFSIDDIDAGRTPFTIEGNAPANSLYVEDAGRIGIGTSTPVMGIHHKDGNTPTLRLDQDGSSGFASQIWDVGGNESNFFIRDVSNGGTLPFRIRPAAPNSSIDIASDGDIGIGTQTPDGLLDVAHSDNANNHALLIDSNSNVGINVDNGQLLNGLFDVQTSGGSSLFTVKSDGKIGVGIASPNHQIHLFADDDPTIFFQEGLDTTNHFKLGINSGSSNGFGIYNIGTPFRFLGFNPNGDLIINTSPAQVNGDWALRINVNSKATFSGDVHVKGTFTNVSSRETKHNITDVLGSYVLDKLRSLDISTWTYLTDQSQSIHMGPMAEDFYSTFNLGKDNKSISPMDTAGVSLAAVKALNEKVEKQQQEIQELKNLVKKLITK